MFQGNMMGENFNSRVTPNQQPNLPPSREERTPPPVSRPPREERPTLPPSRQDRTLPPVGNDEPPRVEMDPNPVWTPPPQREQEQQPPSSSSLPGSCPSNARPSGYYASGCRDDGRRIRCSRPPMPLGSMSRRQQQTMQSFPAQSRDRGTTSPCCRVNGQYFCRGPQAGFAPGTPGVDEQTAPPVFGGGGGVGGGSLPSMPDFPRRPPSSNGGWCDADCRTFVEMRNGRQVRVQRCRQVPC